MPQCWYSPKNVLNSLKALSKYLRFLSAFKALNYLNYVKMSLDNGFLKILNTIGL